MHWFHELKFFLAAGIFAAAGAMSAADAPDKKTSPSVTVSLPYVRQPGRASNQFAVWVEDAKGNFIRTLYVTNYTGQGGFRIRKDCLPTWVRRSGAATAAKAELDAVSGATPATGTQNYVWDCTGADGKTAPPGRYRIFVEGTLYWKSRVLYTANITLGKEPSTVRAMPQYSVKSSSHSSMLGTVTVACKP